MGERRNPGSALLALGEPLLLSERLGLHGEWGSPGKYLPGMPESLMSCLLEYGWRRALSGDGDDGDGMMVMVMVMLMMAMVVVVIMMMG